MSDGEQWPHLVTSYPPNVIVSLYQRGASRGRSERAQSRRGRFSHQRRRHLRKLKHTHTHTSTQRHTCTERTRKQKGTDTDTDKTYQQTIKHIQNTSMGKLVFVWRSVHYKSSLSLWAPCWLKCYRGHAGEILARRKPCSLYKGRKGRKKWGLINETKRVRNAGETESF